MKAWIQRMLGRALGTCRETTAHASEVLDGTLPPDVAGRVHRHLVICPGCKAYRAQMEASVRTLKELPKEEISADEKDRLLRQFRGRN